MNWSESSTAHKIVMVTGVILIINIFLPWFRRSPISFNAFDSGFLAWGGSLLAIAGAVVLLLKVMGTADPSIGSLKAEQIAFLFAAVGALFIVLKLLFGHDFLGVSIGHNIGIFIGALSALGLTYGVFMAMKDAGIAMPSAGDFKSIGGGDDGGDGGE